MDFQKSKSFISELFDTSALPTIAKYIEIPNASPNYDSEWATNGHMENAITLLVDWVKQQNVADLHLEVIRLPERTPLIYMELPGSETDSPTCMLYGHMDKQPPLTESWSEGLHPYKPVFRDGKLYGRGGADDGYSTFSCIAALKALSEQGLSHPRCVILVEAREESGSGDLPVYIEQLKEKIGTPSLVICLDSGCANYDQFWLTTSLRGIIVGTLEIQTLKEGIHSGSGSGIVPSSFRVLRQLLNRIEDADTGRVLVPSLSKEIPAERIEQAKKTAEILKDRNLKETLPLVHKDFSLMSEDMTELILNSTWRSTVSYTGIGGMPTIPNAGNVLRTNTSIKLSVRVPPHVNAQEAAKELKEILEKNPPYNAKVNFTVDAAMAGWQSPLLAKWLENAISEGDSHIFGKNHGFTGEGGSIPFMGMLGEKFPQAQFVICGVLGPGSNAHGPNEFLHIDMCKNVTTMVSHLLHQHSKQK